MYERHFGITGPPFQLSPDPSFYFDGGQHREALTALRRAIDGALPFIVLSGAIGAGKTTVLRTWLAELQSAGQSCALITNTQLDSDELLSAVLLALGIGTTPASEDGALPALRQYMRGLHGAAVVIAIDEAQNLDRAALSSLVDLTQASLSEGARLRIVLAGQPELRAHVAEHAFPQLHALVQQACHLDPLSLSETRRYVEHRLLRVGWSGSPSFDASAFDEIHQLAGGVPRRINVIANRLLLGQFLNDTAHVDRKAVRDIAQMLDAEIADGLVTRHSPRRETAPPPAAPQSAPVLLLVVSGRSDYIKAIALMSAMEALPTLAAPVVVCLRNSGVWKLNAELLDRFAKAPVLVDLAEEATLFGEQFESRFDATVQAFSPRAVVVFDGDPMSHRCALLATQRGLPLVHIGADPQLVAEAHQSTASRDAIGRLANLRFGCQATSVHASQSDQTLIGVGSLLVDALRIATQLAPNQVAHEAIAAGAHLQRDSRRGFGVVVLKQPAAEARTPCAPSVLGMLREVSRDLPLLWPMRHASTGVAHPSSLRRALEGDRISPIDELGYVELVRLLRESTCVLTDSPDVLEETAVLGVPCLSIGMRHVGQGHAGGWLRVIDVSAGAAIATRAIWQIVFSGFQRSKLPPGWDGHAGARIARSLAQWIAGLPNTPSTLRGPRLNAHPAAQQRESQDVNSAHRPQATSPQRGPTASLPVPSLVAAMPPGAKSSPPD